MGGAVKYGTIVADPPWKYETELCPSSGNSRSSRSLPFPGMTLDELCALPVSSLADSSSWLWLWTTNRFLQSGLTLLSEWSFSYCSTVTWHKTGGVSPFSQAPIAAITDSEFLLVGRRARSRRIGVFPSLVIQHRRYGRHSQKPEAFLDMIESTTPGPYLELFARRQRLGWDTWGNEALEHVSLG